MIYAIFAVILLIADQWLKYWVTVNIVLDTGSMPLIPGVVKLVNIHNEGAAFSMMSSGNMRWIFVGLAVLFTVILIVCMAKKVLAGKFGRWCATLAIAGALGNAIDRVLSGYVVDMFKLDFWSRFAVFNIADIVLVISCLLFIIYIFTDNSEPQPEKPAEDKTAEKKQKEKKNKKKKVAENKSEASEPILSNPKIGVSKVSSVDAAEKSEPIVDDDGVRVASDNARKAAGRMLDDSFWSSVQAPAAQKPVEEDEFDLESILNEFK